MPAGHFFDKVGSRSARHPFCVDIFESADAHSVRKNVGQAAACNSSCGHAPGEGGLQPL